jgi:hypothetical protein
MNYLIIFLISIYIFQSLFTQRFQQITTDFSKKVNDGVVDAEIQVKLTPTYVGFMVIVNYIILLLIAFLLWKINCSWFKVISIFLLPFLIPFIEVFSPFPKHIFLFKIMLKELQKNVNISVIGTLFLIKEFKDFSKLK